MSEIGEPASAAGFWRQVFRLFGVPLLCAIVVSCGVVLIGDWRLGPKSPGIIAIARASLGYHIPLIFIVFFVVPSIRTLFVIRRLAALARRHGLRWYEFLDLPEEERARLGEQAGRDS